MRKILVKNFDGSWIDLNNIDPAQINMERLAMALDKLCRWNGHTNRFYSVCAHSVRVYEIIKKMYKSGKYKSLFTLEPIEKYLMAGLLHDLSEALLGDCITPVKKALKEYRNIENRVMDKFYEYNNIDFINVYPAVHIADKIALLEESQELFPEGFHQKELLLDKIELDWAQKIQFNKNWACDPTYINFIIIYNRLRKRIIKND